MKRLFINSTVDLNSRMGGQEKQNNISTETEIMTNVELIEKTNNMIKEVNKCIKQARVDNESEEYIARLCGERTAYENMIKWLNK